MVTRAPQPKDLCVLLGVKLALLLITKRRCPCLCLCLCLHLPGPCSQCQSAMPRAGRLHHSTDRLGSLLTILPWAIMVCRKPHCKEDSGRGGTHGNQRGSPSSQLPCSWATGTGWAWLEGLFGSQWAHEPCDSTCACTLQESDRPHFPSRNNPFLDGGRCPHDLGLCGRPHSPWLLWLAVVHLQEGQVHLPFWDVSSTAPEGGRWGGMRRDFCKVKAVQGPAACSSRVRSMPVCCPFPCAKEARTPPPPALDLVVPSPLLRTSSPWVQR